VLLDEVGVLDIGREELAVRNLYTEHPEIPMDNNEAERVLRGPVVGRKNYYGSGAIWSGELAAVLFSLFHTLELWKINPRAWLTEYLSACAEAEANVPADMQRFLPWNMSERRRNTLSAWPAIPHSA
jgi:hypothetical protein